MTETADIKPLALAFTFGAASGLLLSRISMHAAYISSATSLLVALTLTVTVSGQPRAAKAEGRTSAQKVESISNCLLIDAVQKYEDGDYAGAKTILTAILSKEPGNDAAWYYRAMCNVRLKDGAASEHDFKEAVRIDSTNYWYRYMLAGLYGMTGRKDLTISMYESLLKDFPKRSELYYGLANLYLDQHQDDKALETINDIETQFGKSDATVMTKVNILRGQDKPEEAYKTLHDYYNEEYSSPQIATMLGDYEISMYNDSSAIAYYDEALSIDKNYSPALLGKAEAYRMTRKYPEYFMCLNTLMGDRDASPEGKANYIQAVLKQSDPRFVKSFQSQFDSTLTIAVNTHPKDTSILQAVPDARFVRVENLTFADGDFQFRVEGCEKACHHVLKTVEHGQGAYQRQRSQCHSTHRNTGDDINGIVFLLGEEVAAGYKKGKGHYFSSSSIRSR